MSWPGAYSAVAAPYAFTAGYAAGADYSGYAGLSSCGCAPPPPPPPQACASCTPNPPQSAHQVAHYVETLHTQPLTWKTTEVRYNTIPSTSELQTKAYPTKCVSGPGAAY